MLWLLSGILLAGISGWMLRFWRQSQEQQRMHEAKQALKQHGLTPQLYLATINTEDVELRRALDVFAFSGHIITNSDGEVVGKLCPKAESRQRPYLRLVVSNDRPVEPH